MCISYTIHVVLVVIALTISIGIGAYFAYKYINRNKENVSRYNYGYQATNYWYKWEISKILTLKIEHINFLMEWSMLETLITKNYLLKIDKKSYKNNGI